MKDFFVIAEKADVRTAEDDGQGGHGVDVGHDEVLHHIGQAEGHRR